jgi:hypothetical protein
MGMPTGLDNASFSFLSPDFSIESTRIKRDSDAIGCKKKWLHIV